MDKKDLKTLLASLSFAGLLSVGGITLPGVHAGSGWGAEPGAGSAKHEKGAAAGSGWGGSKDSAVSAEEQKAMDETMADEKAADEDKADKEKKKAPVEKPTGTSGWGGHK